MATVAVYPARPPACCGAACERAGLEPAGMIARIDDADALERAIDLACRAHRGQRYPTPEPQPYVLHLFRVMVAVEGARARMAAVLHDVLEDTPTTEADLRAAGLPEDVIAAVVALTHRPEDTYEAYVEQLAGDALARQVKLADLADNLANNRALPATPDVMARIDRYERAVRRLEARV
jgi:(p)ppGpp synthase/HD superfamily hydrolase